MRGAGSSFYTDKVSAGRKFWLALGAAVVAAVVAGLVACATGAVDDSSDASLGTTGDGAIPPGSEGGTGDGGSPEAQGTRDSAAGCQCTLTANVAMSGCDAGSCVVAACSAGYYDVNGVYMDGCECKGTMNATTCATATMVAALTLGGSTTLTGNLPAAMLESWFQLSFGGSNKDHAYHPHVALSTNPSNEFLFDVISGCSGPSLACGETTADGGSVGLTDWEELYGPDAGTGDGGIPVPPVGSVYVRVYRAPGKPTCDSFVLTVSD